MYQCIRIHKKPAKQIGETLKRFALLNITILIFVLVNCKLSANPFTINLPGDSLICYNSNISINAIYEFNNGPVKWKWHNGDSTNMTITLKGVKANTKVYITGWDSAGNMSSDTMNISIKALPGIIFLSVAGACENDTTLIDLDNYVTPKGGNWYYDSNFLVGHKFSPALSGDGSFWPRYDYTDIATGCSDTDYINIIVFASPVAAFATKQPGGIAPIQIDFINNSVPVLGNYLDYLWDFGDGQFSTVKDPSHVYIISGNLNVCLQITDTVTSCTDRYCKTIQILPYPGYLQISGYVFAGGLKASRGKVMLYEQQDSAGKEVYHLAYTTNIIDSNGYYHFGSVDSGRYLIKAVLDSNSQFYGNYFPTYSGDVIFWKKADLIDIVSNLYGYDIHLVRGYKVAGSGGISGKTVANGNPVSLVQVMLTDLLNNPVIYDFSGNDGSFSLQDISYGSYLLYTEITGITTYPMKFVIDELHTRYENFYLETITQTGIDEHNQGGLIFGSIYPNPFEGNGTLNIYSYDNHTIEIVLYDISGKNIYLQTAKLLSGDNIINLQTAMFEPGIYIYCIKIDKKMMLRDRLLKIK
jgi:PKD repeat protein